MWMDIMKALQVSWKEYILPCSMTSTNCTLYDKLIQSLHHQSCTVTKYQWIPISLTHCRCTNFEFQNELWQPWYFQKSVAKTLFHTKFSDKTVTVNTTTRLLNYGQLQGQTVIVKTHLIESSTQMSPLLQNKIFILEQTLQPHSFKSLSEQVSAKHKKILKYHWIQPSLLYII